MNTREFTCAVIGGGPAGATCAWELSRLGAAVALFEPQAVAEKPCGGGIPPRGQAWLPEEVRCLPCQPISSVSISSKHTLGIVSSCDPPLHLYSRKELDQGLRRLATGAGATEYQGRVHGLERTAGGWLVQSTAATVRANTIVICDGAAGRIGAQFRQRVAPNDYYQAFVSYLPVRRESIELRFVRGALGYLWVFPRRDHVSLGIASRIGYQFRRSLSRSLTSYARLEFRHYEPLVIRRALIPCLSPEKWADWRVTGQDWALAGDAAMFADPLTGEGISYAIASGKLAARAVHAGNLRLYEQAWRTEFEPRLKYGAVLQRLFVDPVFVDAVIASARWEPGIARILAGLLTGTLPYTELRRSLKRRLVPLLWAAVRHHDPAAAMLVLSRFRLLFGKRHQAAGRARKD